MTQRVNNTNSIEISPSMVTFREYCKSFVDFRENDLENGWGWFVDMELNFESARINQYKNKYTRISKCLHTPQTIKEYSSIRSRNSMSNLHDTSMIFQMDTDDDKNDDKNNDKNKTSMYSFIYINTICILFIAFICYYMY